MFLSTIFQAIKSFFGFSSTSGISKTSSGKGNHVRKAITKRTRNEVWVKYCGEMDYGKCYVCEKQVYRYNKGWDCSHVVADAKGGFPVLENLRVCCPKCNRSMGTMNLYEYKNARVK